MAGRPKKAPGEARSNGLRILLTDGERAELERAARSLALDTSTWARTELLKLARAMEKDKGDESGEADIEV
jgi:hypothetical protein